MQEGQGYGQGFNPYMMGRQGGTFGMIPGMIAGAMMPNPADSAMPYYNQMPGMYENQYNPYIHAGMGAMGNLQGQYSSLMNNPSEMMNKIGQTYQQSPAYAWQRNQALQGANQAAAAGGMAGTPQNQQFAAGISNNMANQDYYNYMDHAMNMYGMGMEGEQGLNRMGYDASNQLAQSLGNTYMNQGNLAMSGQGMQNNLWGSIMGMI